MNKNSMMVAAAVALATTLGVSGVVGAIVAGPGDASVAAHSNHSTGVQTGVQGGDPSAPADTPATAAPAAAVPGAVAPAAAKPAEVISPTPDRPAPGGPASDRPAPGGSAGAPGQEAKVAPLPDVASAGDRPGNGKAKSLGEALAQPHGVAAAGVTPEGAGVNDGKTKQAPGLALRPLARGQQDAGVNDAARTGGCAPGYGDGRSCLPVAPPSAAQHPGHGAKIAWTCEELLTLFPQGIPLQVPGTDPLGLDEDGNGIACA